MRRIAKQIAPAEFTSFLRTERPKGWDSVSPEMKKFVRRYILCYEQAMLSAYTEKVLDPDSNVVHVDHFVKQEFLSPQDTLVWENLFVDAHAKDYGADYKDNGKNTPLRALADYANVIHPAVEDPHHYFCYDASGNIRPRLGLTDDEKRKAEFTISTFNLDHRSLVKERSDMILSVKNCKDGGLDAETIKQCFQGYSFPSLVEYFCDECFEAL